MTDKERKINIRMACVSGGIFLSAIICTVIGYQNNYLTPFERITAPAIGVITGLLTIGYLWLPHRYNRRLSNIFITATGVFLLSGQFEAVYLAKSNFKFYLIWIPAFYLMLTFTDIKETRYRRTLVYFGLSLLTVTLGALASNSSIKDMDVLLLINTLAGQFVIVAIFDLLGRKIRKAAAHEAVTKTLADSAKRLKIAAETSNAAREEAERANSAKSTFIANMSHELRTPLNAIIGFSDILSDPAMQRHTKGRINEYANDINISGRHLLSLVNDILDVARIEAGKIEIHEEEVYLKETVQAAINMMPPDHIKTPYRIDLSGIPDALEIIADPRLVKQIMTNLISNALKFTPDSGKIYFTCRILPDGRLEIGLTDEGIGISEETLSNIMQPFVQDESVYTRQKSGAGLGLHIVNIMMELHDGTCQIDSELDKGTTAKLIFPANRVYKLAKNVKTLASATK
jgi:signal transduction histidine kinase